MNKLLIEFNLKNIRIFFVSVPKKISLVRKDKVKEFVKSLKKELNDFRKNINKNESKIKEFKKKYFMINENNNIIEYDFFNDEIIHQKLLNFINETKDTANFTIMHELEVMDSILDCYYERCSLNIDYSDMAFRKNENSEMKKIISHYENCFCNLKEKIKTEENILETGLDLINELNCLIKLALKVSSKASTILFGQILINNFFKAYLKILYNENLEYLECENRFFLSDVKESEYFKNILNDNLEYFKKIIKNFENEEKLKEYPEYELINNNLAECLMELEGGA